MKKQFKTLTIIVFTGILSFSCQNDNFVNDNSLLENSENTRNCLDDTVTKEDHLVKFAKILSKAIYNNKDLRKFIKNESLKQFDKNYDVLFYLVKDKNIGKESFRDILISYSSEEEIEEIETNVPLLNILVSKIAFFDVTPENLDIEDAGTPVAVSKKDKNVLFLNGKVEVSLGKGEIPDFHVFVVNENNRVVTPNDVRSRGSKIINFKSPNYDRSRQNNEPILRATTSDPTSITLPAYLVGKKAIEAYKYFNKDDGSIRQRAFQRDYIYYGITPKKKSGNLNRGVTEYISFIRVQPNEYFKMSDQREKDLYNNDPYIDHYSVTKKKYTLSEDDLIDKLWTQGGYEFRFEIFTSSKEQPQVVYVPLRPDELWNFNIEYSREHSTWFKHSKHTYKINPKKFTSKKVFLNKMVSLGKWNLAEEALSKYVKIYEEDESIEIEETYTFEMSKMVSKSFKGETKLHIGLEKIGIDVDGNADSESSVTEKISKSFTIKRQEESDYLGDETIYFYTPIIEGIRKNQYKVHIYNTGSVEFAVSAL